MLAGGGEWPNEGHFRPIEVITRPGSLFHPLPPAPTFIGGWAAHGAVDAIYRALGKAVPESRARVERRRHLLPRVVGPPRDDGEPWADGSPYPVGQGASARRRRERGHARLGVGDADRADRGVGEPEPVAHRTGRARADSGGAGRYRGGNGLDMDFRLLEDAEITAVSIGRACPPGLAGGGEARPNRALVTLPDGTRVPAPRRRGCRARRDAPSSSEPAAAAASATGVSVFRRRGARGHPRGLRQRGAGAARLSARVHASKLNSGSPSSSRST